MAVGDESIGYLSKVEIDDGGTGGSTGAAYTVVDALVEITAPGIKTGTAESKRLTVARIRKIATIEDGGEWSFKQQFTNAGYARMEAIRSNKRRNAFKVTVTDDNSNTVITVTCLVTENKITGIESDKITEFETMLQVAE